MSLLKVNNIHKHLSGKHILKGVSFEVQQGEMYGFLGPNGAGKTTTMKSILGFITPEEGDVELFGKSGISIETKKRIGFMPENTYLYKHLTGEEFLRFHAGFFGMTGEQATKKVDALLEKVGLSEAKKKYLKEYSKGMLQRVGLAQAMINDPELLFLDEPMSGLDPIGRKMVKDLLVELNKKGTTIFFNTHILADVESICDKISIIHQGKIIVQNKKLTDISGSLEDFFIEHVQSH
ncbi:ABC transporter ATP-binding protein [Candidatus Gracilibacteria bacterium]|nr:ABC transporter ATP-binding protein [Candidatus Gracilibacteria bacterium]